MNKTRAFHGLEAYSPKTGESANLQAKALAVQNMSCGEICTTDRLVGKIGLKVLAVHTLAANYDISSVVDMSTGLRQFEHLLNYDAILHYNDGNVVVEDLPVIRTADGRKMTDAPRQLDGLTEDALLAASESAASNGNGYPEFFATQVTIVSVVYDDKESVETMQRAVELATNIGVPVEAVRASWN